MRNLSSLLRPLALAPLAALAAAWAQPDPDVGAGAKPAEPVEEIVVRGTRSLLSLRIEVDAAREGVYAAFNAHNSDDDLDIHCSNERRTGSGASRRVCVPVYAAKATAEAGRDFVRRMQRDCSGGVMCEKGLENGAAEAQRTVGRIGLMDQRLDAEMQRLARENPEVAKAIQEYDAKERAYREAREARKD